jgi:hypothetical protein
MLPEKSFAIGCVLKCHFLLGLTRPPNLKNVKKKEPIAVFNKKKRATAPASTADPKKVKKIDFDFYQFFRFLCQGPRYGSKVRKTHRSEVNINRVMAQNQMALFKPRPLQIDVLHAHGRFLPDTIKSVNLFILFDFFITVIIPTLLE